MLFNHALVCSESVYLTNRGCRILGMDGVAFRAFFKPRSLWLWIVEVMHVLLVVFQRWTDLEFVSASTSRGQP